MRWVSILTLACCVAARGDIIQDEGGWVTAVTPDLWQSFIAADETVGVVSIFLFSSGNSGQPMDRSIVFALREGQGLAGTILAECVTDNPPTGRRSWIDCTFNSPVSLTVGNQYTIQTALGAPWWVYYSRNNPYAQGRSSFGATHDLRFRILQEPLPGACCINDGCIDGIGQQACDAANGTYHGDGRSCSDNNGATDGICYSGSCCTDIGCLQLTETECVARDDWQDWTLSSYCYACVPPLGACCITGICFADKTEAKCDNISADWAGPLTDCDACPPCDGPDFDGDGDSDDCDFDIDDDGVPNDDDVCDFTPLGQTIGANGTTPADLDGDCDVDLEDFAIWQLSFG